MKEQKQNKRIKTKNQERGITLIALVITIVVLIILATISINAIMGDRGKSYGPPIEVKVEPKSTAGIQFALTMNDKITDNSTWCGTFQLIWNDLKNELAKQDIVFTPQVEVVENLNKGDFDTSKISDKYYYKTYGTPSVELKEKIEKEIKEKFNETSDILDDFDWTKRDPNDYFLYCMLRKDFKFEKAFEDLETGTFANNYQDIKYFGIKKNTKREIKNQVDVLYYNSDNDFAIQLNTKGDDEVILSRSNRDEKTFHEIYDSIQDEKRAFTGTKNLTEKDEVKIPNISFNVKKEYKELQNRSFYFSNGTEYVIDKAIQTIEFELDKTGGKIKSEAGISTKSLSALPGDEKERKFYLDDTFTIFLQEKGKDMPYFAARISDITKFQ